MNMKGTDGDTGLIAAIKNNLHVCVTLLLNSGTDVNIMGKDGKSALIHAAFEGDEKVLTEVIKKGAVVNIVDGFGRTPLDRAAHSTTYRKNCVELLLRAGADVNFRGPNGRTPLINAASVGDSRYLQRLLDAGADVNAEDDLGTTALMVSAPSIRAIRLLLRAGAYLNKTGPSGENSMSMCLTKSTRVNQSSAMLLLSAGEKIDRIKIQSCGNTDDCSMLVGWVEKEDLCPLLKEEPLSNITILNYMRMLVDEKSLKNICRQTIRKCMINANPYPNLFTRVPRLGLPPSLQMYLLYDMTLNEHQKTNQLSS